MYRDELVAARARVETLEAELDAERKRREAAEAEAKAAQARAREAQLLTERQKAASGGTVPFAAVTVLLVLFVVVAVIMGVGWSSTRDQVEQLQRDLDTVQARPPVKPAPLPVLPPEPVPEPESPISTMSLLALQRAHQPELKACYDAALRKNPQLTEVKATVTVTLNPGKPKVDVQGGDATLRACIARSVSSWAFPPVPGARTVTFPIIFRGN